VEVHPPPRHRLAFEDLQRPQALLGHPVGLVLDLGQLADDLPGDPLAGAQLALLVFDDRTGLGYLRALGGAVDRGHISSLAVAWRILALK